jgi:hypothetical protein
VRHVRSRWTVEAHVAARAEDRHGLVGKGMPY